MTTTVTDNVDLALGTDLDISVAQGATYTMEVTAVSGEGQDEAPFDLTGFRAHLQVRKRAGAPGDPIFDCTSVGDDADLVFDDDLTTGVINVRLPANKTVLLKKDAAYDLFLIDETDATEAIRLLHGAVIVSDSVTIN